LIEIRKPTRGRRGGISVERRYKKRHWKIRTNGMAERRKGQRRLVKFKGDGC